MTTHCTYPTVGGARVGAHDELLDALMEVIVRARGPAARAAVVAELVQEMGATIEWLHHYGTEPDDARADELTSIERLVTAAREYRQQMKCSADRVRDERESAAVR